MRSGSPSVRGGDGFTMVEVLLALLVGAIVIAGMYEGFTTLQKWWIAAGVRSDQRQNARAGLETVTRDLEMAGYQTTNYGDVNKTGIAITLASANEIEVDQQRPDSATIGQAQPVYQPRLVYYHLATDTRSGRQNLYRQIRTQPGLAAPDELVAENVSDFALTYFDKENVPVPGLPPHTASGSAAYSAGVAVPAGSPLRAIRRIQVSLTTTVARALPFGPPAKDYTLTASVTPQNLAATDEVVANVTPPAVPTGPTVISPGVTGPAVIDTCSCVDKLRVRWNHNTEPDLAGYVLFFGPTDKVTISVRALADRNNPEVLLNTDQVLVTRNADRTAAPNTYAIQVAAYNTAGNMSGKSGAVSGNPNPDVRAFGGAIDTTVNPCKPAAPTGLSVAHGAADGQLVVSWAPPADGSATVGFRLYRSETAFASGHVADALLVADEATLTKDVTSWTDTEREGCKTYYYAVASVNCDETLVATYAHNTANLALSDYSVGSGAARDTVPPPPPSLAGSQGGELSALISLTNPLEATAPDLDRTVIYWSKVLEPSYDATATPVSDGTLLPDTDCGAAGTFRNRGSQVIVFDSEFTASPGTPELEGGATYNLLAVNFDRCNNPSTPERAAVVVRAPACVDDPAGPPPGVLNGRVAFCQPGFVTLAWDAPVGVTDLAGFRIERSGPGGTEQLTDGPTALTSWRDARALQVGAEYTYRVTATDCSWENYLLGGTPAPYAGSPATVTIGTIRPGGLQRYAALTGADHELDPVNFVVTQSDDPAAYTYHNNVVFSLENTSLSPVTIMRMAVSWDNPNVVIDQVVVGGSPSSTTERTVDAGGVASGVPFAVNAQVSDLASGTSGPSGAIPVRMRFMTPSGAVNRLADMRSQRLLVSLWLWNDTAQDAECPNPTELEIDVPRGPVLGGFSQSAPGLYGIDSYEVTGPTGTARDTDIRVPSGVPVNVYGTAFDNTRDLFADGASRGFATLKLVGIGTAAADPAATPAMPTTGTFFERPLQAVGGNRYAIYRTYPSVGGEEMPQVSDQVVWYYALAVDNTGNWSRVPEPDSGSYAYFQPPFDVCTATPRAPVLTVSAPTSTQAVLTWTAPTAYDSGIPIPGSDALTYDVYVKTAGGDPWPSTPAAANLTATSFVHTADLLASSYYYMVRAKNSCAAGPRPSGDSNVAMECQGSTGVDCSLFVVPATAVYGDPIALRVNDFCTFQGNTLSDSVVFRVQGGTTTTDFTTPETGDTGAFTKTITAVWTGGGGDNVLAPTGTLGVSLVVGGTLRCAAKNIALTGAACFTVPNPPTSFSAVRGVDGSGAAVLTWVKPNFSTNGAPLDDLAGYELNAARCIDYDSTNRVCRSGGWAAWTSYALNSPAVQTYTWAGFRIGDRYKFRMRAKDSCATPNYSAWTSESTLIQIR
jgi:prepilin-type N-terminal cleavage/methylation domain-containing protein